MHFSIPVTAILRCMVNVFIDYVFASRSITKMINNVVLTMHQPNSDDYERY